MTLRTSTPTLVGCWGSYCCVFVLIITYDVHSTIEKAGSTGFVMQGTAAAKTQGWKRGRGQRGEGEGERKGTERAGRSVPQQETCSEKHVIWNIGDSVSTNTQCKVKLTFYFTRFCSNQQNVSRDTEHVSVKLEMICLKCKIKSDSGLGLGYTNIDTV